MVSLLGWVLWAKVERIYALLNPLLMSFYSFVFKTNLLPGVYRGWPEAPIPRGGIILLLLVLLSSHTFPFAETSWAPPILNSLVSTGTFSILSLFLLLIPELSLLFMSERLANPDVFSLCASLVHILLRMGVGRGRDRKVCSWKVLIFIVAQRRLGVPTGWLRPVPGPTVLAGGGLTVTFTLPHDHTLWLSFF